MDFVSLMRYSRTRETVRAIARLDDGGRPLRDELRALWGDSGFAPLPWGRTYWVSHANRRQVKRPRGPDLTVALRTADGFFLTFGQGVCCVYHLLRWRQFLIVPGWQQAMLASCEDIADRLGSPDVALMSDFHPSYSAFFDGAGFDACLRAAVGREAEVGSIAQLYEEPEPHVWDSHGFWRLRSTEPRHAEPGAAADPAS